eukprot:g3611.t1
MESRPGLPPPVLSPRLSSTATGVAGRDTKRRNRSKSKNKNKKAVMMMKKKKKRRRKGAKQAQPPTNPSSRHHSSAAGPRAKRLQIAIADSSFTAEVSIPIASVSKATERRAPNVPETPSSLAESTSRSHIPERALKSRYVQKHMAKVKKVEITEEEVDSIVDGLSTKGNDPKSLAAALAAKIRAVNLTTSMRSVERGQEEHDSHEVVQMEQRTTRSRRLVRQLGAIDEEADFSCHTKTASLLESRLAMLRRQANQLGVEIRDEKKSVAEKMRRNKIAIMLAESQDNAYKPHVRRTIKRLAHGDEHTTRLLLSMGKDCDLLVRLEDSLKRATERVERTSQYTPTLRNMLARDKRIYEIEKLEAERLQESIITVNARLRQFADLRRSMDHATNMGEERLDAVHAELSINRDERLDAIRVRLENLFAQRKLKSKLAERERQRVDIKHQAMINAQKRSRKNDLKLFSNERRASIMGGYGTKEVKLVENRMLGKKIMETGKFPSWDELQSTILDHTSVLVQDPDKLVERMFGHAAAVAALEKELKSSNARKLAAMQTIKQVEAELQMCLQGDGDGLAIKQSGNLRDATENSGTAKLTRNESTKKREEEERKLKFLYDRFSQKRKDVHAEALSIRTTIEGIERLIKDCEKMYVSLQDLHRQKQVQRKPSPIRSAESTVLKRRPSTLNFVTVLKDMDKFHRSDNAEDAGGKHGNENSEKDVALADGSLASQVIIGLDSKKIAVLRTHIPQLFAYFSGLLTKLNREISPPKPEASQPQTIAPGGTEKGQNDGGEKEDAQDLVGEADQNETAHNHNGVDETVKGSGATGAPSLLAEIKLSKSTELLLSHHNVRVQSALAKKEITAGERRQQTAVLRSRVLRESRVASECRPENRLLRAIHSTLQAEQELLVLGIDPNLGNVDHAHNVASLRHEDKEGHVTIQSANSIVYPQDHFFDSEDEDFAGQRATAKHRLSPKRRPSLIADGTANVESSKNAQKAKHSSHRPPAKTSTKN